MVNGLINATALLTTMTIDHTLLESVFDLLSHQSIQVKSLHVTITIIVTVTTDHVIVMIHSIINMPNERSDERKAPTIIGDIYHAYYN